MKRKFSLRPLLLFFVSIIFFYSCEKEVFTESPEEPVPNNGQITITSKPSNAAIYLNDKNTGYKTPHTLTWLDVGSYEVTLKLDLYPGYNFGVWLGENSTVSLYADFTSIPTNYGSINFSSSPQGAGIYLNDTLINTKTPTTITNVMPGYYKYKCVKMGYRSDSTMITVKGGQSTYANLVLEDTTKWVNYITSNSGLISNIQNVITSDKQDHIWIGTSRGVQEFINGKGKIFSTKNSPMKTDLINSIVVDKMNRKWIGTSKGLYVYASETWIDYSSQMNDAYITAIAFDSLDNCWVGTKEGLYKLSNGKFEQFTKSNSGLKEDYVTCLMIDKDNRVWVGSFYSGVGIFDGSNWEYIDRSKNNLFTNYVVCMLCDNHGKIWVGTEEKLIDYDGTNWTESLQVRVPISLFADSDYLLIGTKYGWFTIFDFVLNEKRELYELGNYGRVQTVTRDKKGDIWFGTYGYGIVKLKKGNF